MKNTHLYRPLWAIVVPLVMAAALSGCLLLGAGAATVGGCALLDENEDERVTEAEFSAGLFDTWDTDDDDALDSGEFDEGTARSDVYDDWSDDFDDWDEDGDGSLTEAEFAGGIAEDDDAVQWADRQCDDLGL